jgi:hypothetical protein
MATFWSYARRLAETFRTRGSSRRRHRAQKTRRFSPLRGLERLEDRLSPAVTALLPGSTFTPEGPQQIGGGQVMLSGPSTVSGAITSIVFNPLAAGIVYVSTTNGGIWRTLNINAVDGSGNNFPTWTPLTDTQASLSETALTFDAAASKAAYGTAAVDGSKDVVYAGTGRASSAAAKATPGIGVLKTTDGGTTWSVKGYNQLQGLKITAIVATQFRDASGLHSVLLVSTRADDVSTLHGDAARVGVWRSTDGGDTWARVSDSASGPSVSGLAAGDVTDLKAVRDPANPDSSLIYAANIGIAGGTGAGVYESADGGATWKNVTTKTDGTTNILGPADLVTNSGGAYSLVTAQPFRIQLAVFASGSNAQNNAVTRVYAGITSNKTLQRVIYWDNRTGSWQSLLDTPASVEGGALTFLNPGNQANIHFSMAVDPNLQNKLFLAGDLQKPIGAGSSTAVTEFGGRIFRVDAATNYTTPMQMNQARGELLTGNNANNTDPHADSRVLVFDSAGNLYEGDDGGINRLTNPEGNVGTAGTSSPKWVSLNGNLQTTEVGSVAYDPLNREVTIGSQDTGVQKQTMPDPTAAPWTTFGKGDGSTVQVGVEGNTTYLYSINNVFGNLQRRAYDASGVLLPNGPAGTMTSGLLSNMDPVDRSQFLGSHPMVVNAVNPQKLLLGWNFLWKSDNRGNTVTIIDDRLADDPAFVSAVAYGGINPDGTPNENVIYRARTRYLRASSDGGMTWTSQKDVGVDTTITQIAVDPKNWKTAYAVADNGKIFVTTDGGNNWADITAGALGATGLPQQPLRTAQLVPMDVPDLHFQMQNGNGYDVTLRGANTIGDIQTWIQKQTQGNIVVTFTSPKSGQVQFKLQDNTILHRDTFTVTALNASPALAELGLDTPGQFAVFGLGFGLTSKILQTPGTASPNGATPLSALTNATGTSGIHRNPSDQDVLLVGGDQGLFRLFNPVGDPSVLGNYPAVPTAATQARFQLTIPGANNDLVVTAVQPGADLNKATVSLLNHGATGPARVSWDPVTQNLVFDLPSTGTAKDVLTLVNGPDVTSVPMTAMDSATTGQLLMGAYQYKVSFVSAAGVEGNLSDKAVTVNPAVGADYHSVQLAQIPTGPAGTLARRIYRTAAGSSTFDLVGTLNDNTTTTFTDLTPDRLQATAPSVAGAGTTATDGGTGGKLAAGTYRYRFSFVDSQGVESQLSDAVTPKDASGNPLAVAANHFINLANIPTGPTGTVARRIYRALTTDDTFTLVGTLNDNTTFSFTDRLGTAIDVTTTDPSRPAKPTGITATVSAGGRLAVGAYKYRVTILDATGVESNASDELTGTTTAGNQTIKLAGIAARTAAGSIVRIYRTQAGGTTYTLIATLTDTSATQFIDTGTLGFDPTLVKDASRPTAPNITSGAVASGVTGTLAKGTYSYRVTYLDANGVESNVSAVQAVTVANDNSQVGLTIPAGPTGAKGRRIYRSDAAGNPYVLVGTINDNTTTAFADSGAVRDPSAAAVGAAFRLAPFGDNTTGAGTMDQIASGQLAGGTAGTPGTPASVTVINALANNDLKITAKTNGTQYNGVNVAFVANPDRARGKEQVTWSPADNLLVFEINPASTGADLFGAMGQSQNAAAASLFSVALAAPDPNTPNTGAGTIPGATALKRLGGQAALQWTRFGSNLPDALVTSLAYSSRNNGVLVVGQRGRGAWELTTANTFLTQKSVLQINSNGDRVVLQLDPSQPAGLPQVLQVYQQNDPNLPRTLKGTFPLAAIQQITVTGTAGANDTLVVDARIRVPGGIVFDGMGGTDTLNLPASPGQLIVQKSNASGMGTLQIDNPADLTDRGLQINFVNTSSVQASLLAGQTATPAGDLLTQLGQVRDGLTFLTAPGAIEDALTGGLKNLPLIGSGIIDLLNGALGPAPAPPVADQSNNPAAPGTTGGGDDGGDDGEEGGAGNSNQPASPILSLLMGTASNAFSLPGIGTTITTLDGLTKALDALDATPSNVTLTQTPAGFTYDMTIARTGTRTVTGTAPVSLSVGTGSVALTSTATISADVSLHLKFGVDRNGFFLDTTPANEITITNVKVLGAADTGGRFGLLQVDAPGTTLTVDPGVTFTADLKESDPDPFTRVADNFIRTGEPIATPANLFTFAQTTPTGKTAVTLTGTLNPAGLVKDGPAPFALPGNLTLKWADINNMGTVAATANGSDAASATFLLFQNLKAQDVVNNLKTVAADFQAKSQVDVLKNANLPLTTKNLYDVLNTDKATLTLQGGDIQFRNELTADATLKHFAIGFQGDNALPTAQYGFKVGDPVQFAASDGSLITGTVESLGLDSVTINYASSDPRLPDMDHRFFKFTRSGTLADQFLTALGNLNNSSFVTGNVFTLQDIIEQVAAAEGEDLSSGVDTLTPVTVDTASQTLTITPTFRPAILQYNEPLSLASSLGWLSFDPTGTFPVFVTSQIRVPLVLKLAVSPPTNDSVFVAVDGNPAVEYHVDEVLSSPAARSLTGAVLQKDPGVKNNSGITVSADYKLTLVEPGTNNDNRASLTELASTLTGGSQPGKNIFQTGVQGFLDIPGLVIRPEVTTGNGAASFTPIKIFTTPGTATDLPSDAPFNNLTELMNLPKKVFATGTAKVPVSYQFTFAPPGVAISGVTLSASGQATITGTANFSAPDLSSATVGLYYDTSTAGFHGTLIATVPAFQAASFSVTFANFAALKSQPYYFYAVASDGVNAPVYSDYFGPFTPPDLRPVLTVPAPQTSAFTAPVVFSAANAIKVDAGGTKLPTANVTITALFGQVQLGTGAPAASITVAGDALNAGTVTYVPPANPTSPTRYDVLSVTATRSFGDSPGQLFTSPTSQIPIIPAGNAADLSVTTKFLDKNGNAVSYVLPGDQIQIQLTVTNSNTFAGTANATNVKVTDALPFGVTLGTSNASAGTFDATKGVWTVGAVNVGNTATLTLNATVRTDFPVDQLVNTATVGGDQVDFQPGNNQATATIPVPRVITVTNAAADEIDPTDNKVSLREAINQANADPTHNYVINFPSPFPGPVTMNLATGALPVTGTINIVGPGAASYTISGTNSAGTSASRIFDVQAGGSLILSGVTLTKGKVAGTNNGGAIQNAGNLSLSKVIITMSSSDQDGGAIYNTGALVIDQSTLSSNTSKANGGAVSSKGGSLTMTNTTVGGDTAAAGNTATLGGGGLYLQDLSDSITGGTIKNNTATGTAATVSPAAPATVAYGGGLVVKNGHVTLTNVTLANNTAPIGGGLEVFSKDPNNPAVVDLSGDTFDSNQASGANNTTTNRGGALAIYFGSLVRADSSTFSGNAAVNPQHGTASDTSKAGAVYNGVGSTFIVTRSTFSANTAPRQSGAIDNPGTLLVAESTFANNTTDGFGGAIDSKGRATVKSSTFSGNQAKEGGAGIALFSTTTQDGTLYLGSSIVAGNTRGPGGAASDVSVFLSTFAPKSGLLGGAVRSLGYNLIGLGATSIAWQATDQIGTASAPLIPMLGPLAVDNGGPIKVATMVPQPGSPAINWGRPNPGDATDQRGLARVVGDASDVGAVETPITTGGRSSSGSGGSGGPSEPPSEPGDSGTGTPPSDPDFVEGTPGTLNTTIDDSTLTDDASAYTVSVDWGDGSPVSTGSDVTFSGSAGSYTLTADHTYADEGTFNGLITISKDGVDHTVPFVATVADADALAPDPNSPVSVPGVEGTLLDQVVVARFANPGFPANTTDEFTATINWGDKAVTAGTVRRVDPPEGSDQSPFYEVIGSHLYTEDDTFAVNVSVFDDPAGPPLVIPVSLVIAEDPNFAVTNAPAITTADGTPTGAPLVEGTQLNNILLATFQHANGVEAPGDFQATIDWGDGTTSDSTGTVTLVTPADPTQTPYYEVRGSHVYAEDRTWTISVTIQDTQDTEVEPNSPPVTASTTAVVGEDPTFTATGGQAIQANAGDYKANVPLATFQHSDGWEDPTNDFQVTIDWGDGTLSSDPSAVGTVQEDDAGVYTVLGSHAYTAPSGDTPYKITVTITDVSSTDDLADPPVQVVVSDDTATVVEANQAPTFTSADHATFTVGTAGSFTVTTQGAPNAAITETDKLPANSGITFHDNGDGTATIAGTPAAGTGREYKFNLTADNGVAPNATQDLVLTVNEATVITSPDNATFTGGEPGSFTVTTRGFPTNATLTETDNLPAGSRVTFHDNGDGTATIAGIPRNRDVGSYQLTITADNGIGTTPATQTFNLTIGLGDFSRAYVQSLYLDVLNRAGSADEVNGWLQLIAAGMTRDTVAKGFWESPEHRRLEVDGYYGTYLHRLAGPDEENWWGAAFLGGATERDVIRGFVTSREYLSTRKGDVEFVTGLYQDVLGRPAQPDEVTGWLNVLDSGVSRGEVAVAFLDSREWANHVVSDLYLTLLNRQADPGGEAFWANALSSGATVTSIAELFLTSDEYSSKT